MPRFVLDDTGINKTTRVNQTDIIYGNTLRHMVWSIILKLFEATGCDNKLLQTFHLSHDDDESERKAATEDYSMSHTLQSRNKKKKLL